MFDYLALELGEKSLDWAGYRIGVPVLPGGGSFGAGRRAAVVRMILEVEQDRQNQILDRLRRDYMRRWEERYKYPFAWTVDAVLLAEF